MHILEFLRFHYLNCIFVFCHYYYLHHRARKCAALECIVIHWLFIQYSLAYLMTTLRSSSGCGVTCRKLVESRHFTLLWRERESVSGRVIESPPTPPPPSSRNKLSEHTQCLCMSEKTQQCQLHSDMTMRYMHGVCMARRCKCIKTKLNFSPCSTRAIWRMHAFNASL
jgi:hypothetical protein